MALADAVPGGGPAKSQLDLGAYISQLDDNGKALAAAAGAAGLDAHVPSCPGWSVRHLLAHVGYVHRWATAHVAEAAAEMAEDISKDEIFSRRPADAELLNWYEAGQAALVASLRAAPADLQCWTFMAAPSPLVFWARRQAHETAVHRVDAELAAGRQVGQFSTEFAVDGLDELLCGFAPRKRTGQAVKLPWSLAVEADEGGCLWTVTVGPEAVSATRQGGPSPDCKLSGPAHELYLALWNRRSTSSGLLRAQGDESVLQRWASFIRVDW
ncbi:MAG TPA: maleylpyruvate isomerase family mycothiol-dependent enzyme [Acidimicrobiales bacterium]|nr:maleylpyruvate isomerase family mycothiol-dependent enzyme [Acidimicrobiales bacterium]